MRKKIIAANWKMNLTVAEGEVLLKDLLKENLQLKYNQNVIICPPLTHLYLFSSILSQKEMNKIILGAQNCFDKASGAYTGEVSIPMLKELGVRAVIVGHSERRTIFREDNELIKRKVDALLTHNMIPIFCCGEPLEIREKNEQNEYVKTQIENALFELTADIISQGVIIAYEPIWAIGTGKTATTKQAQEMHAFIRSLISVKFGEEAGNNVTILYGGSCNASNAKELFECKDVDGGLIGGASLSVENFLPIINAISVM